MVGKHSRPRPNRRYRFRRCLATDWPSDRKQAIALLHLSTKGSHIPGHWSHLCSCSVAIGPPPALQERSTHPGPVRASLLDSYNGRYCGSLLFYHILPYCPDDRRHYLWNWSVVCLLADRLAVSGV